VRKQQTLAESVSCAGTGLHAGVPVRLVLSPARAGTGIVFVRTDRLHAVEIAARPGSVTSTRLATTLGSGDASIATVEHLLAALYGLGIDNARITVDGPELPVMDGSAASFVYLIRSAGLCVQHEPRAVLRVLEPVEVDEGGRRIRIEPARGLWISMAIALKSVERSTKRPAALEPRCLAHLRFSANVRVLWNAGRQGRLAARTVGKGAPRGRAGRTSSCATRCSICSATSLLGVSLDGHVKVSAADTPAPSTGRGAARAAARMAAARIRRPAFRSRAVAGA
jgi:hypothetical protein